MPSPCRDIDASEIVEAGRRTVIDLELRRAPGLDHIAEGPKGGARQRFDFEDCVHPALTRSECNGGVKLAATVLQPFPEGAGMATWDMQLERVYRLAVDERLGVADAGAD